MLSDQSSHICDIPKLLAGGHLQHVRHATFLTLAGTGHFASFHGIRRGGGGTTPLPFRPIALELRGKKLACSSPRDEEIDI